MVLKSIMVVSVASKSSRGQAKKSDRSAQLHIKKLTTQPAEMSGQLDVKNCTSNYSNNYPPGKIMRSGNQRRLDYSADA